MKNWIFISLLFCTLLATGQNEGVHSLHPKLAIQDLWPQCQVMVDSSGEMRLQEARNADHWQTGLYPYQHSQYPVAYWLKLNLTSPESIQNHHLIFKQDRTHDQSNDLESILDINRADAWYFKNDSLLHHYRTGSLTKRREQDLTSRKMEGFPFSIHANDTLTLLIRVQNFFKHNDYNLALQLQNPPLVSRQSTRFQPFAFFLSSAHLLLGVFCLILFFVVREWSYLIFSLFCIIISPHFNLEYYIEWLPSFFLFQEPRYFTLIFTASTSIGFIFFLLFGRSFSNIKNLLPDWNRYYEAMIACTAVIAVYVMAINYQPPFEANPNLFMVPFIGSLPVFIRLLLHKHILAKIYGFGATLIVGFMLLGFLWATGVNFPFQPFYWGFLVVLLFFSVCLAWKIRFNEQAKAEAEQIKEMDRMKSRFFANISHEFRTPISLILGPLKQAEEQVPASEDLDKSEEVPMPGRYIRMMKRNALRLQNLVNQLLDLSRLDNGKAQLQVSQGKIIKFLRAIVLSFESRAEHRGIDFHTTFPEEPQEAWFDRDKVEKIITNLLSNAFKYTPDNGKINVTVDATAQRVKVQVSDSGSGIGPQELDKIFERFYRIESGETEGAGIGLSLVKELVNLHHGQISVDSTVDVGTTFKLTIPIHKAAFDHKEIREEHEAEIATLHDHVPEEESLETQEQTEQFDDKPVVLVVEDNPDLRTYIRDILQKDFHVVLAADGKAGQAQSLESIPDLIISDVRMPKMDGFEFCEAIKSNEKTSHIPVILLTAKAGQQHKMEGLKTGADAYLTKPFDRQELKVRTANLIRQRQELQAKFSQNGQSMFSHPKVSSMDEKFVKQVIEQIEDNIDNEFYAVDDLAEAVGFSRSQLFRKLRAVTGKSPTDLIREIRLERAHNLLKQGAGTVSEIAYQVGYNNLSYFTKSFKTKYGKMPSEV